MALRGQLHALAALPQVKMHTVPFRQEAEWAPEPVWTRWRREKIPAPGGNGIPVVQPVA